MWKSAVLVGDSGIFNFSGFLVINRFSVKSKVVLLDKWHISVKTEFYEKNAILARLIRHFIFFFWSQNDFLSNSICLLLYLRKSAILARRIQHFWLYYGHESLSIVQLLRNWMKEIKSTHRGKREILLQKRAVGFTLTPS